MKKIIFLCNFAITILMHNTLYSMKEGKSTITDKKDKCDAACKAVNSSAHLSRKALKKAIER